MVKTIGNLLLSLTKCRTFDALVIIGLALLTVMVFVSMLAYSTITWMAFYILIWPWQQIGKSLMLVSSIKTRES